MLKLRVKQIKVLAVVWLLFISVLFFLPGQVLPKEGWLDKIFFDKWVHFGFFALLVFLWRFYFPQDTKYAFFLLMLAVCYGMAVEVIQHFMVNNRSFDIGDLIADTLGSVAGIMFWAQRYIKNRPL